MRVDSRMVSVATAYMVMWLLDTGPHPTWFKSWAFVYLIVLIVAWLIGPYTDGEKS
jgi:heme A synthase